MKFNFRIQDYQTKAVQVVVDCFRGQPYVDGTSYRRDLGRLDPSKDSHQITMKEEGDSLDDTGFKNEGLHLDSRDLLRNIQEVQEKNSIKLSEALVGDLGACSLDVEMETGTGKTYVYIKTMYELYKSYGWSKFIIVVPSIAIREGVMKSFEMTRDHFMDQYGQKVRFFVYNSKNLNQLDVFSSDAGINAMI